MGLLGSSTEKEMKKLPYIEGSVILVPLRKGGFARGVVARAAPKGKALLGYFFAPRLTSPEEARVDDLDPAKALLRVRFGDLGLINGDWRVIGTVPNWSRAAWPMPDYVRHDPLGVLKPILVRHADDDPLGVEAEYVIDNDTGLATESMYGYGAVEIELTKLLR
jgi:hypothetical protein